MQVIIDTNVFVSEEWSLKNVHWTVFWQYIEKSTCEVLVPIVVIEETVNKYRERLQGISSEIWKLQQPLKRLMPEGTLPEMPVIDVNVTVSNFRDNFVRELTRRGVEVLPWPTVTHEDLVRRCNQRRRPFGDDDRGYRDALIWGTILERVTAGPGQDTILLTGNGSDFFAKKAKEMLPGEKPQLHPHLVEDLKARKVPSEKFRVLPSVADFNQIFAHPTLERLAKWKERLSGGQLGSFQEGLMEFRQAFTDAITSDLDEILDQQGAEDPSIPYLDDPISVRIDEVLDLIDNSILVKTTLEFDVSIDFFMHKSEYYVLHDNRADFWVDDSDWNESYITAQTRRRVEVEASVEFDTDEDEVVDIAIDSIERVVRFPQASRRHKRARASR